MQPDETRLKIKKRGFFKTIPRRLWIILKQKDTPHRIALGMALGIFTGVLPLMGIQMAIVAVIAIPLRANIKAALVAVWISNPITVIPLYWANYRFGLLFFPVREVSSERFDGKISTAINWDWSEIFSSIKRFISLGSDVLVPLWLGATILAVFFGILTYVITYKWVEFFRNKQKKKREAKRLTK